MRTKRFKREAECYGEWRRKYKIKNLLCHLVNMGWLSVSYSNKSPIRFNRDSKSCLHNTAAAGLCFVPPATCCIRMLMIDIYLQHPAPPVLLTDFHTRWRHLLPCCVLCIFICSALYSPGGLYCFHGSLLPGFTGEHPHSTAVSSRQRCRHWTILQNPGSHSVTFCFLKSTQKG